MQKTKPIIFRWIILKQVKGFRFRPGKNTRMERCIFGGNPTSTWAENKKLVRTGRKQLRDTFVIQTTILSNVLFPIKYVTELLRRPSRRIFWTVKFHAVTQSD